MECRLMTINMMMCRTEYINDPNTILAHRIAMTALGYNKQVSCWLEYFKDIEEVCEEITRLQKELYDNQNI